MEIAKVNCFINRQHYKKNLYITVKKTVVIYDFNAHSEIWGYNDKNAVGDILEEFLNTTNLVLVSVPKTPILF